MNFRKKKITKGMALTAALALFVGVGTLLADLPGFFANVFELGPGLGSDESGRTNILGDGNASNGPDWADLFNGSGRFTPPALGGTGVFVKDDVSAGGALDRNVYSGGPGDKNSDFIADWTWTSSSVPAKDDISNTYAYTVTVGGHKLIFVGAEREDPSGDSHIDIEFFQNQVKVTGADSQGNCLLKQCGFSGTNKDGDLLVNMDYTNGGALGTLSVRKRNHLARNDYDLVDTLTGQGCHGSTTCGFTNGGPVNGGPWDNFDNHGAVITTLQTNAFTEFGIDITALGFGTPCLATIQVKTRSSQSFTATLKDFSLHGFEACTATAVTQIHSGESVGASHTAPNIDGQTLPSPQMFHDRAIVTGQPGGPTPDGKATFKFYPSTDNCTLLTGENSIDVDVTLTEITAPSGSNPGVSAAESPTRTSSAGSVSYKAIYTPGPGSSYTTTAEADCEKLIISIRPSATNTDIRVGSISGTSVLNTAVDISGGTISVVDVAFVTGTAPVEPTGAVRFYSYPLANCTGTPVTTDIAITPDSDLTDGKASVTTGQIPLSSPGTFLCLKAQYLGDTNYSASDLSTPEPLCAFPFVH